MAMKTRVYVTLKKGVYTLGAWVRTESVGDGASGGIRLVLDSRSGGINEWGASEVISGTADWTRHDPRYRGLACLGDGRLPAGQREASGRVLGHDRALEDRQQRPVRFQPDVELRASDAGHGERCLYFEAAGTAAEEVRRTSQQVHHPGALVLDRLDGHLGIGVHPEHRLVEHGDVSAASLVHTNGIAR